MSALKSKAAFALGPGAAICADGKELLAYGPADEAPLWKKALAAPVAAVAAYMACPIFWETSLSVAVLALMSSTSLPGASLVPTAVLSSASADSTSPFSAAGIFSPLSARNFSVE